MKKYIFIFFILFIFGFKVSGQYRYRGGEYYSHSEDVTIYLEADYNSRKSPDKKNYVYRLLRVYSSRKSNRIELFSKILTDYYGKNISYYIGEVYDSNTKKFALLISKNCFYIYDIKYNYLSGPHKPYFWGEIRSIESGTISKIKISKEGDNLYGTLTDGGTFLFNTCDLKNVNEILPLNLPFFSESRIFEMQKCEQKNKYNIIYVCELDSLPKYNVIISSINLIRKTNSSILNLNKEEIDELIMETELYEARYIIVEEIIKKHKTKFTVIDIITGKIIDLPENLKFTDEEKLRKYLKSL